MTEETGSLEPVEASSPKPEETGSPEPPKNHRSRNILIALIGGLVVVGGAAGGIAVATSGGHHATAEKKCPGGYYAVHCSSNTPAETTTTPALSGADETFVTDMRSAFNFEASVDDETIANFGEAVCTARGTGSSQATEVAFGQAQWTNNSAGAADQMVRLAEQDICPQSLTAETVTYIVSGSGGVANVNYGPDGSESTGQDPMTVTQDVPQTPPSYYAINAQLQGGGQVSCSIQIDGVTISSGTASGGFNIATCEISSTSNGWVDDNSSH